MVRGKPTFSEIFPQVKEILYKAKKVIAYNISFEMGFLQLYDMANGFPAGYRLDQMIDWGPDPMYMYSAYTLNEKWRKLDVAAAHFKYSYEKHDALEDAKATLFVYKSIVKYIEAHPDKEYILKYGMAYDETP